MIRIKLLTIIAVAMFGMANANAQTVDDTFCFVDANGNVVADGTTVTFYVVEEYKIPEMPFLGKTIQAKFDLSVKNTTNATAEVGAKFTTESMPNGSVQFCFPSQCEAEELPEVYISDFADTVGGTTLPLNSEWLPAEGGYGEAKFKLQILKGDGNGNIAAYGPTVNIVCVYADPAGIIDAESDNIAKEVARYDIQGNKLSAPTKGLNIIKMSNGKIVKKLVR